MATDSRSLPAFFNTNTDFQNWCQGIAAQIVVAGWTKTSDTGQINNTTVAKPSASNTSQGYEVYEDTATDIFFKIEYGSGNGGSSCPGTWITVGTGSDGAGNITGPTCPRVSQGSNVVESSGVTETSYCSGDGSYLALVSNTDIYNPNASWAIIIDKVRNSSATSTSEGFVRLTLSGSSSSLQLSTVIGGVATINVNNQAQAFPAMTPNSSYGTGVGSGGGPRFYNGNLAVMPLIMTVGQIRFLKAGVLYNTNDFGSVNGLTFSASNFGGTHTYMTQPITSGFGTTRQFTTATTTEQLAMLWE